MTRRLSKTSKAIGDLFDTCRETAPVVQISEPKRCAKGKSPLKAETETSLRFLTINDVAQRFEVSRVTIWRWVKNDKNFPAPVKLSPGTSRWFEDQFLDFENQALVRQESNQVRKANVAIIGPHKGLGM